MDKPRENGRFVRKYIKELTEHQLAFLRAVNGRGYCDPKYLPVNDEHSKQAHKSLHQLGLIEWVTMPDILAHKRWRITAAGECELMKYTY